MNKIDKVENFLKVQKLAVKPILVISKNLQGLINYHHAIIGSTEWSGILLYKIQSGSVMDLKNLVILADHFHTMNIGSTAYTEFEIDADSFIEMTEQYENFMEMQTGLIHTHHNMGASFSSTDIDELKENVSNFNQYLSLVVDFKGKYVAKLVFEGEIYPFKTAYKNEKGILTNTVIGTKEKVMFEVDMDIRFEVPNQHIKKRLIDLFKAKKIADNKKPTYQGKFGYGGGFGNSGIVKNHSQVSSHINQHLTEDDKRLLGLPRNKLSADIDVVTLLLDTFAPESEYDNIGDALDNIEQYVLASTNNGKDDIISSSLIALQGIIEETYTIVDDNLQEAIIDEILEYLEDYKENQFVALFSAALLTFKNLV